MIINMTTVASRQKHYIDRTLESLFQSDGRDIPLNLILGSSDTSHVERYRNVATLVAWDEEAESQARQGKLRHNCNVNAIRSLRYGDDDYCLCCEDDIIFDANWYSQLMLTVAEIDRKEYVLNLGQGGDQSPHKRYVTHKQPYLCGAQGIFYPSKRLRNAIANYIEQNTAAGMNDALIGVFAKRFAALYNTTPALVGHIGQVSCFRSPRPPGEPERGETSQAQHGGMSSERNVVVDRRAGRTAPPSVTNVADVRRDGPSGRVTSEIVVALLRASLGTGPLPDSTRLAQCDWTRFALLARHHGLVPILYRALQGRAASVPAEWLQIFKSRVCHQCVSTIISLKRAVDEIGAIFSSERIPVIVMKGAALLRTLYDDQGLRILSDVDLLVDERDVERADTLLQARGLLSVSDHAEELGSRCHYSLLYCWQQPRTILVELHWRIFERYRPYIFDLDAVRAQARPLPGMPPNVLVMAPEHELAHLCMHLDRHAIAYRSLISRKNWCELLLLPHGSGRLVWLYDIALYLQRRSDAHRLGQLRRHSATLGDRRAPLCHARAVATRVGRRTTARGPAGAESRSTTIGRTDSTQRGVGVASRQRNAAQRIRAHTASALADAAIRSDRYLRSHLDLGLPAQRLLACQVRHA